MLEAQREQIASKEKSEAENAQRIADKERLESQIAELETKRLDQE